MFFFFNMVKSHLMDIADSPPWLGLSVSDVRCPVFGCHVPCQVFVCFLFIFFAVSGNVRAETEVHGAYYHFGVFDYEEGDYESAEMWLEKALTQNPDNPYYLHWTGRVCLKTGRFAEGVAYLEKAWSHDSTIPGLKSDLAFAKYRSGDFSKAAALFMEIIGKDPENGFAQYHAGMSLFRAGRFQEAPAPLFKAGQIRPDILAYCRHVSGICRYMSDDLEAATDDFEYARDHADSEMFRKRAEEWLAEIRERRKIKPYGIWIRASGIYDGNVPMGPDGGDLQSDEEDCIARILVSGHYDFTDSGAFRPTVGYGHYQTWHRDLKTYDLTGMMPYLSARFSWRPAIFELGYHPAWYRLDSESYLESHAARLRLLYKFGENARTGFSYAYADDNYSSDDDRDGVGQEAGFDFKYDFTGHGTILFGDAGVRNYSASHSDYSYFKASGVLGFLVNLPWNFTFRISGRYEDKKYDHTHTRYGIRRNDDTYSGVLKVGKTFFDGLAAIFAEYDYTENDSNIIDKNYKRNRVAISTEFEY